MHEMSTKPASQRLRWWVIAVLLLLWASAAGLRDFVSRERSGASGDHLWEVAISVPPPAVEAEAVARVAVPDDTNYLRNIGQRLNHPGWHLRFSADPEWGVGRQARLVAGHGLPQGFELSFTVHQSAVPLIQRPQLHSRLSASLQQRYLRSEPLLGLEHEIIAGEVALMSSGSLSHEEMLGRIFSRARQLLTRSKPTVRTVPEVLADGHANELERAYVLVALCRASHIPARLVSGLILSERVGQGEVRLHHWVEVWRDGTGWQSYDPAIGYQQELPSNFLPLIRDRSDVVEIGGVASPRAEYSVINVDDFLELPGDTGPGWKSAFFLTRLPLDVRTVLAHLLLLPLAVFVTTMVREVSGIQSYGTFTPALLSLAVSVADWQMALMTLAVVLLFGLVGRSAIPFDLPRRPRLTIVLLLVALGVSSTISLLDYLDWNHDGKVVLLPVIVMSMLVDLFYKALEKEGAASAIVKLGWTLLLVAMILPVTESESLGHWLVAHPEAHLLTMAAILAVTGYRGRKLAQVPGLAWLGWPPKPKRLKAGRDDGSDNELL